MNVEKRIAMEKQVITHFIRTAQAHGYEPIKVFDGEAVIKTTTETEVLDAVFAVDESMVYFRHPEETKAHVIVVVLGNDGWDAISDSSMGPRWDDVMMEADQFAIALAEAEEQK